MTTLCAGTSDTILAVKKFLTNLGLEVEAHQDVLLLGAW